jgi:hypothetical protein
MAWWDWHVQDKEDNNMATTTISFFSSFNKIKSSWFGNPFPHLKKPTTLVPLPMWHLLEEYLFID